MAKMSGGEALVQSLVREGVEVVFGIPGIHMSGIIAALRDEPAIRMITTRHEAGATHMADGYARASGKPGVALVVPGAGLYNAASGIATAHSRSSPVLVIVGQISRGLIGKNLGIYHEISDQPSVVRPVTKWQRQALRPREIPDAVCEAFRQMRTGRPRPVLLEVPPEAGVEREEVTLRNPARFSRNVPSQENLREAAHVIAQSRLPLIFAGGGVALSGAEQALLALVEATNIPVITSAGGKGAIPDRHPLSYGACLSPAGERPEMNQLFDVMQSADVVIGIGTRFSLGNPAGEASTVVNINIDDSEITRVQSNTLPLHGDARATIEALLPFLIEAGAGRRPSPAEAVSASRRLIAYHDIMVSIILKEPQYPIREKFLDAMRNSIPEDTLHLSVWDGGSVVRSGVGRGYYPAFPHPLPRAVVCGVKSGGTSQDDRDATIMRRRFAEMVRYPPITTLVSRNRSTRSWMQCGTASRKTPSPSGTARSLATTPAPTTK